MIVATWKKSAIGYSPGMKATIQSLGFRFGNLAYSCDVSAIAPES